MQYPVVIYANFKWPAEKLSRWATQAYSNGPCQPWWEVSRHWSGGA